MQPTALLGNQPEYLTLDIPGPGTMTAAAVGRAPSSGVGEDLRMHPRDRLCGRGE
jgi:hypothetical protein